MNRHPRILFALLALPLALSACSGLVRDAVRSPEVSVTDVELVGTTLTGADLLFEFRVDNPNALALVLDTVGYRLRLNGQQLLDGRRDERTRIEAQGRSVVQLPVTIRYSDVLRVIDSFEGRDKPEYDLEADFGFDVPVLGIVSVPVRERGEIPLDRLRGFMNRSGAR